MHVVYRPSLCVVAQGEKVAHLGHLAISYGPQRFFFSALPVPAEVEVTRASPAVPLLGLILELPPEDVGRVCLDMFEVGGRNEAQATDVPAAFAGTLSAELRDALRRLLVAVQDPVRQRVLYASILREVVFALLAGPHGPALRQFTTQRSSTRAIIEAARFIDAHFERPLKIPELARGACMSESTFYDHFKRVTALSPLQYQKRMRLQKGRTLILSGGAVTETAFAVGYASPSQFSRDFRALFGHAPSQTELA